MKPILSIIIPTYQRDEDLRICLNCLDQKIQTATPGSYEIIVSDDAKSLATRDMIAHEFPDVRWVEGPARGPAANRNRGAAEATATWLAFTDDDCQPDNNWIQAMINALPSKRGTILEGKTVSCGERAGVDWEAPVNESGGYLWSCNFCVHRDDFESLRGFDEGFPAPALEDVDFRVRALDAGHELEFLPSALILHPWRKVRGINFALRSERSFKYFIAKHPNYCTITNATLLANLLRLVKQNVKAGFKYRDPIGSLRMMSIGITIIICRFWRLQN